MQHAQGKVHKNMIDQKEHKLPSTQVNTDLEHWLDSNKLLGLLTQPKKNIQM